MDKENISAEAKRESLEKLIDLCHMHLFTPDGEQVLSYLKNHRKLTDETIRKFKLGVFPRYADVVATNLGSYTAWKLGIIGFNEAGDIVSKFSTHNVLIPIYDQNDVPLAIIGRSLFSEEKRQKMGLPKYINSFFKKSTNLFGLNFSKDVIREKNEAIMMEGNFDVITAYQNGLRNVVGISSANLSRMQLLLAARYGKKIRLMLDNDEAGQIGTKKALEAYRDVESIDLSVMNLPSTVKDIDEFFIKQHKISELYSEQDI